MTRSQFLGLLTLPFLTRFFKKEEPKFPTLPYKNMAIFIPQGRQGEFLKITNDSAQVVSINGYRVHELGVDESIEINQ